MNKYSAITLFSLLFLLSSCFYGPKYYEKDGQMYVKGNDFKWGKYNQLIEGADPATFREMEYPFSLDANHVYYLSVTNRQKINILEGANPATFEVLDSYYCRDSLHVWFYRYRPFHLIPEVDSKSFHELDYGYARTDSIVFYEYTPLYEIDPNTIVVHTWKYIEDKNDVYWKQEPLHVSDRETFTIVYKNDVRDYWAKDKNYVYYLGYHENDSNIVRSAIADYDSFEVIDSHYARDKVQVYYCDSIIYEADPASFEILADGYTKDKDHVFYRGKAIEGMNPATFKVLESPYSKDDSHIFSRDKIIVEADYATFKILTDGYAKDKDHVFYQGKIVEDADPKTFKVKGEGLGKDKYREYNLR